jgi:ribosomal-protein-alanine N-acetyltransferase
MFTIRTERLGLRPFQQSDLDALADLMANADFMRFSLGPLSRKKTAEFLEKMQTRDRAGEPSQFAVLFHATEKLIGFCGFFLQRVDGIERIEIAYRFHPDYWGQGIATEAARAVRDHAFQVLKLNQVISLIHPDNIASGRVAEKNGMTVDKKTVFRGFPTLVYAIDRECWGKH